MFFDNKAKSISASKFAPRKTKMVHLLGFKQMVSSEIARKNLPTHSKDSKIIKNFHSIDFNGTIITVNNCCSPDAILHCLCNLYAADSSIFNVIDSNVILDILKAYANDDISMVYEHRVKLLLQKGFKLTIVDNEVILNAQSNIGSTFSMMCADVLPSGKISYTCDCGTKSTALSLVEIDSDRLNTVGIKNLASCIMLNRQKTRPKCKTCTKAINKTLEYSSLIFFDLQSILTSTQINKSKLILLSDIPPSMTLNEIGYHLTGVIEFQPDSNHYTAHCCSIGMFTEFNDIFSEVRPSNQDQEIEPHILIYAKDKMLFLQQDKNE